MNIPESIEILAKEKKDHHSFPTDKIGQAEQLLIKAGEEVLKARGGDPALDGELLQGETED